MPPWLLDVSMLKIGRSSKPGRGALAMARL
jgi:hypothetical protein